MKPKGSHSGVLYAGAAVGFAVFVTGVSVSLAPAGGAGSPGVGIKPAPSRVAEPTAGATTGGTWRPIAAVVLQTLGCAILFPIVVSFAYDRLRERWLGDEVWRLFGELSDAGIIRVYKDRESAPGRDNAQTRLAEEFLRFRSGELRMMGPTLRVFFNPLGPFIRDIDAMIRDANGKVLIKALIERSDSPSVAERCAIEEPSLASGETPQTERDAAASVAQAKAMAKISSGCVTLRRFMPAPYCTAIIFPHVAFFSPNLLAPVVPVRLPMILFQAGSHGYNMLAASFEYLWTHKDTQQAVPEGTNAGVRSNDGRTK
jgi:hypothetical protein